MNNEATPSAKELFLGARELDAPAREDFLREGCAGDDKLRRRVEALLRADTALGPDLLAPAPGVPAVADELDRYELLEVLGEGGFGTVYRARRRAGIDTEVALKVLRVASDSQESMARFRTERRALEAMDHPGIARVLDAGLTKAGRPYIVMELVNGLPITAFCDDQHLTIADRLQLMSEVCRAVQHAHHKGVIHRDLKPSNILAWRSEGRNFARIIDFGVAKALQGETDVGLTQQTQIIGTPAYMSPEQARGAAAAVDARADCYALGTILYEVLCGAPTIDPDRLASASPAGVERLIAEIDPPPPSVRAAASPTLAQTAAARGTDAQGMLRRLRGELDWIVARALAKTPDRRYPTAEALAADLERVLRGDAVEAAPPSRRYRLWRTYRRHRAVFIGGAVAATALIIGASVAAREAWLARQAELRAAREQRIAEAVSTFLRNDLLGSLRPEAALVGPGGRDVTMREVMDKASRRLDANSRPGGSLEHEPGVRASLHTTFASTYTALGRLSSAESHARAAVDAAEEAGGGSGRAMIRARIALVRALMAVGKMLEAVRVAEQAAAQGIGDFGPTDPDTLEAELFLGVSLTNSDTDVSRARDLFASCYAARADALGPEHSETLFAGYLYAHAMLKLGDVDGGETLQRRICEARRRLLGDKHPDTIWSRLELLRAAAARGAAQLDQALPFFEEIIRDRAEVLGPDHYDTLDAIEELASFHLRARRLDKSEALLRPLLERWRRVGGDDHPRTIRAESLLGETLARSGDFDHGMPLLEDSLDRMLRLYGDEHFDAGWIRWRVDVARKAQARGSWEGL